MIRMLTTLARNRIGLVSVALALSLPVSALSTAQGAGQRKTNPEEDVPVFSEYRGVQIGMTAADVRQKLGSPKDKGDTQDYFVFAEFESVTVVYDPTQHKVVTLSIDFLSGATGVPAPKAVVGSEIEAKADGSFYKMVRYPKAGFWVSYYKAAGDAPLTSITIQKID